MRLSEVFCAIPVNNNSKNVIVNIFFMSPLVGELFSCQFIAKIEHFEFGDSLILAPAKFNPVDFKSIFVNTNKLSLSKKPVLKIMVEHERVF
jgi:hypothetical protein